jgi:enolase-phosphatase E1
LPAEAACDDSIRAILLDIEGTTTPIDFVYKTLFPYARTRLNQFLLEYGSRPDVHEDIERLRTQHRADTAASLHPPRWMDGPAIVELGSAAAYAAWLIARDNKCSALKSLQGKIWQEGYRKGELHGEVYPDVPPALARWTREGKIIAIFSSGSVLAQKLLFSSTPAGDLTKYLRAYFDTTTGPKNVPESYTQIAKAIAVEPPALLFVSDAEKELDAARGAGVRTALMVRPGAAQQAVRSHRIICSFAEILPEP